MNIIERMKISIINLFSDIADEELKSRLELVKHMLDIENIKNNTYRKC